MVNDTERREAARRLRGLDYSDLQESLICAYLDALGIEGYADWVGIAHRLADLIEPSCDRDTPQKVAEEMFGKMRHSTNEEADAYNAVLKSKSVEIHPVDREALLALADEMGHPIKQAVWNQTAGVRREHIMAEYAHRIREALGVSE